MSSQPEPRTAMASTKADLRELKSNSRATVAELQDFLRQLKGKSPQEMLGMVAASQLFRSLIISTLLVAGTIFALTAIPYFMAPEEEQKPVAATPEPAAEPEDKPEPEPADPIPAEPVPEPNPLESLGVGEELPAPPNKNPLEDQGDDFLKDLE